MGHLALGYITGKVSSKLLASKVNIPLLLTVSVVPDIDFLFMPFLEHRGPTHSLVTAFVVFVPILAFYGRRAVPYFVALVQHSLIGDYIGGNGPQLLWPFTTQGYGIALEITSLPNVIVESLMFLGALIVMLKTDDISTFFETHKSNLILIIPVFALLLPMIPRFPSGIPAWLIPSHLVYLFLFVTSILITLHESLRRGFHLMNFL